MKINFNKIPIISILISTSFIFMVRYGECSCTHYHYAGLSSGTWLVKVGHNCCSHSSGSFYLYSPCRCSHLSGEEAEVIPSLQHKFDNPTEDVRAGSWGQAGGNALTVKIFSNPFNYGFFEVPVPSGSGRLYVKLERFIC